MNKRKNTEYFHPSQYRKQLGRKSGHCYYYFGGVVPENAPDASLSDLSLDKREKDQPYDRLQVEAYCELANVASEYASKE